MSVEPATRDLGEAIEMGYVVTVFKISRILKDWRR
jgi:hypothetical protein